jgi:hypothetical protein
MESTNTVPAAPTRRTDLIEIAHILVLIQGAILVGGTMEAVFFLAFAGSAARVSLGLTAAAAVLTLASAAGLARGSSLARRWTLIAESAVFVVTSIDLVLALLMTGEPLGPVPLLAGLALPATVIAILRRR